ncbi:PAS domain-containing protein [Rubrivirga sp.]|uniref:PAS domain-containing protein n=1 Tax=Rubrivirga sp. TaxID=1885344 RepID=UPI003B5192AE
MPPVPPPSAEGARPPGSEAGPAIDAADVLASISDAFFALDAEWRFTYVNDQAVALLDRERADLLGKSVWDEFPEAVGGPFWQAYHRAVETREAVQFDAPYDPLGRHFSVRAFPFDGGITVYFTDVSEARRTEAALRESERQLRQLTESLPQLVWTTTPDGYHDYFNERWYAYTGMPRPDEPGGENRGGAQGFRWADYVHPDDLDAAAARWAHSLATGEPYEVEYRFRRADDGAYRWFIGRADPLRAPDGQILRWFGTCTDIDDQKRAELALRQSEARLQLALEGGGIGSWEWDTARDVLVHDDIAGRLWGVGPEGMPSAETFFEIVHPDDLPGLREALAEAVERGGRYDAEFRIFLPNGRVRWLAARGRMVPDGRGGGRLYGFNFDVTERRQQEEALRQKNAEMERFAYTVSHDLKSPLVTITGFLGLLQGHLAAGRAEKAEQALARVLGAADRMGRLIEDLLVLSRSGRTSGDPAPVDLDAVAGRLADEMAVRAEKAGGAVEVRGPLGVLLADRQRVEEALENLLANAVRYGLGGGGSRVVVRSEPAPSGGLRLVVEDDGPGVPEAYRDRVFDLFQRLDTEGEGTGVGLAVVARVMEVMGGEARVEGAGGPPGREGARFVLEVPPHAVHSTPADLAATSGP